MHKDIAKIMRKRHKLVTIDDVAKEANVSPSTVSFSLNEPDKVNPDTRRHVLRITKEMGYSRVKKVKKRGYIGLISDDYWNMMAGEFYNIVIIGVFEELKKRGADILVDSTDNDPERFPKMITKNMVDGVLFLGTSGRDLAYIANQKKIPIVLIGHALPEAELHSVVPDGRNGGFQATKHLIDLGHKKIAMVTGRPSYDPIAAERLEGYKFALSQNGIRESEEYIAKADFCHPESAVEATKSLLELPDPPTAIFYSSDSLAYRGYPVIKEKGLQIPQDISVVGFDDLTAPGYAILPKPSLTTVRIDRLRMGKSCVELLYDIINDPNKPVFKYTLGVELVVKESTAPPQK